MFLAMERVVAACAGLLLTVLTCAFAQAQPSAPQSASANPQIQSTSPPSSRKPAAVISSTNSQPAWSQLTPAQQQALRPLAGKWHELGAERKRKWLEVSKNYHTLPASEQVKMHSRMSEWIALSQQQRTQARLNFVETKKLTPEQKAAQWQAYQELSAEEKKKLATKARTKPTGVAVVKPAAASKKLTQIPVPSHAPKALVPPVEAAPVQAGTLLPQPAAPTAAVPAPAPTPVPAQPSPAAEGMSSVL